METYLLCCVYILIITLSVFADVSTQSRCFLEDMKVRIQLAVTLKNETSIDLKFESGVSTSIIFYIYDFCYRINRWMSDIQEKPIDQCDQMMIDGANHYFKTHNTYSKHPDVPCVQYEEFLFEYPMSPYIASRTVYRHHLSNDRLPYFCHSMYKENIESLPLNLLHSLPDPPTPSPRLLCMIFTTETKHEAVVPAVIRTWASRCTGFLAFSTLPDLTVSALNIPHEGPEAYDNMWAKVVSIWKYVYEQYREEFDWFYIAGDDTYVIVENLLLYLHSLETLGNETITQSNIHEEVAFYLGRPMYTETLDKIFNSGGAGYVLNRKALSILYEAFQDSTDPCHTHVRTSKEDFYIGQCLAKFGVYPFDTRDAENDYRERFHALSPGGTFFSSIESGVNVYWIILYVFYRNGTDCCSPHSISFHDIKSPTYFYSLDSYVRVCKLRRVEYEALSEAIEEES